MDAKGTAAHHRIHLKAFAANNNIPTDKYKTEVLDVDESHSKCTVEIDIEFASLVEVLRPHEKID
jgi:hypothetical protein